MDYSSLFLKKIIGKVFLFLNLVGTKGHAANSPEDGGNSDGKNGDSHGKGDTITRASKIHIATSSLLIYRKKKMNE